MKHATAQTLASIATFLDEIRSLAAEVDGFKEKKTGVFYRKSRAFLHFHEDPEGIFVDVRLKEPEFDRFPVTTRTQQKTVLAAIKDALRDTT